uniref:Reverse transcriptase domain-containing protein n=1 Tax=Scylla olivacea TaxID=85551 RepID=A0A0P4VU58_SCYOL
MVSGCTSERVHPMEAFVPQGSILDLILWNVHFNSLLQSLTLVSAFADDATLSHSYSREEAVNVIDTTNHHLCDILVWSRRWQVKYLPKRPRPWSSPCSREDARVMEGQLKFGEDILAIKDSINFLGVEVDSRLSFNRHLESVARKASLRVTLLRRVRHLLDAKGLMTL